MRWFVDISTIGSTGSATRFCLEAEQWQKALQEVRARRGDTAPFGNFSIELLDDGYRAIDPLSRTRYVVQRAPDDAPVTPEPVTVSAEEATKVEPSLRRAHPPAASGTGARSVRPSAPGPSDAPRPRGSGRASDRGKVARGRAPSIPDDPVPRAPATNGSPAGAPAAGPARVSSQPAPRRPSDVPLVPPKPMQAETAFERMTGGVAVPLPAAVPASAELATEVLPSFRVLSKRTEDPTPSSPLTYREMALAVAQTTSLRDAEAIARAEFEAIRNAIAAAPKGKFIQLAVFDHEFSGRPSKPPVVTLSFKDWRDQEPELRFPLRDGASARSAPPAAKAPSAPPAAAASPTAVPPTTVAAPTVPIQVETVVQSVVPTSMARPTVEPPTAPTPTAPSPSSAPPSAPAAPPSESSDVIRPTPIIGVVGSFDRASDRGASSPPAGSASPSAPAPAQPAEAPIGASDTPAPPTERIVPSRPPSAPAPAPIPEPTPSQIRRSASDMAGDDEKTLVKPSEPPPPMVAGEAARAQSAAPYVPAAGPVGTRTEKMASVPPPAGAAAVPPAARPASVPPPAAPAAAAPVSAPPATGAPLFVRPVTSPRKSGDDLITDLFEACSDLGFLTDPLDGSEFVLNLVLESIPSAVALVSFFDINAREFVVVRQGVSVAAGTQPSIPNVLLARASEFTPLLARAMRSRRAVVVSGTDVDAIHEDGRWRALGVAPRSLVVAPAISGGRYLGIVEVADPLDGAPFTEGDGHALSYIGEQFAEFLAQRELDLDRERITRPKLNQLASGQLLAGSATRPVR